MSIPEHYTEIALDISCEDPVVVVPTKQLDNLARILKVTMYDSDTGESVPIASSLRAEFHLRRPDGVLIEIAGSAVSIDNNIVTVQLTESCLAVAGKALADVKLYENDKIFSAASFALDIQRTATGTHSETRGILTRANLEIINKSDFDAMSTKEINTLYVVKEGSSVVLYLGNIPIAGGSSAVGEATFDLFGTTLSTQGVATLLDGENVLNLSMGQPSEPITDTLEEPEENTEPEENDDEWR